MGAVLIRSSVSSSPTEAVMMAQAFKLLIAAFIAVNAEMSQSRDNPIRRVVTMLQAMQTKVIEEGKKDEAIHSKYMCFCKSQDLEKQVAAAEKKLPQLDSSIKEFKALTEQLTTELEEHKKVRADAEATIKEATSIREKDAAAFAKESADKKKDLAAMGKAITAIEKGMNYEFLQTDAASTVQRLIQEVDMSTNEREVLLAFFSQKHGDPVSDSYNPASGQIVGLMKTMKEDMEKELAALTSQEEQAIADFTSLMQAKNKELAAATQAIQDKQARFADAAVQMQTMKEDYDDTAATLEQDKAFLADKEANCAKAEANFETVKKTRAEELLALAETIKLLNDDDALELFKKTLPSPSLLQLTMATKQTAQQALKVLHTLSSHHDPRIDFITLALHGKKVSFDKVLKMIDDMVKLLDKEQYDDDLRQEICVEDLDQAEDKLKTTEASIKNVEKTIEEDKDLAETTADEIGGLKDGIKDLDKSVTDSTETRKEEHDSYTATLSENKAAKDLLLLAKNRLNKFYNPKLYKEAPKEELAPDEQIAANMGVTLFQQGSAMFMQISTHKFKKAPPPAAVGAYQEKKNESTGVIEMIDMLVTDLDKEIKAQQAEEADEQADYEKFMADAAAKRTKDGKSISQKEKTAADLEAELAKLRAKDKAKLREAYATTGVLGDLHQDCDWLLANFETRKTARAAEKESLAKAKGILSGMEVSFVQTNKFLSPKRTA